jgi:hypothetical protein
MTIPTPWSPNHTALAHTLGEPQRGRIVGEPVVLHTTDGLPAEIAMFAGPWFQQLNTEAVDRRKTEEQRFTELAVQPGDRLRLRQRNGIFDVASGVRQPAQDAAVLEGDVLGVKFKNGRYKVRIKGFETSGNAVWWPIRDYHVEVLHRAYRWTAEDRVIAELAGLQESQWVKASESYRQEVRLRYAKRAERIKKMLGAE